MQHAVHADGACSGYELWHVVDHRHLARRQVQRIAGQQVAGRGWLGRADLMGVEQRVIRVCEPVPGVFLAPGAISGVAEDGRPAARAQARGEGGQLGVPRPGVRPSAAAICDRYCGSVSAPVSICPAGAARSMALPRSSAVNDSSSSHGPSQDKGGPTFSSTPPMSKMTARTGIRRAYGRAVIGSHRGSHPGERLPWPRERVRTTRWPSPQPTNRSGQL